MTKLVRDKIPQIMIESGEAFRIRFVFGNELWEYLKEKLVEEANELMEIKEDLNDSNGRPALEELADVLEVVENLQKYAEKIAPGYLSKIKEDKKDLKGGFEKGIVLEKFY